MRTQKLTSRGFAYGFGWSVWAMAACSQPPSSNAGGSTADQTQVQVGQVVPGPGTLSQGTSQGGIVAGVGNAVPVVPGMPSVQNIALTLSLAAASALDLCLSAPDPSTTQTALSLRSCAADPLQKWVYVNGLLQSNKGGCLTIDPTQNNSAVISACDANSVNQQLSWAGGQLTSSAVANTQMVLQVPASPATTTSTIGFAPYDIERITQQRWHLAQQDHDASQVLVQHGVAVAVLEKSATCLSAANGLKYATCLASDVNQKWTLTNTGFFQNEGTQKCLGLVGTTAGLVDCTPGPSVAWIIRNGLVMSSSNTCLDIEGVTVTLKACDSVTSSHFIFGLSRGT